MAALTSQDGERTSNSAFALGQCTTAGELELHKIEDCSHKWSQHIHFKGCGTRVLIPLSCSSRWCATCFDAWSKRARMALKGTLEHFRWPSHMVLTVANKEQGCLNDQRELLQSSFRRLRQRKIWKSNVTQYVASWGITWGLKGWHLHIHVAADCKWIHAQTLTSIWQKVTRGWGEHTFIGRRQDIDQLTHEIIHGTKGDMAKLRKLFRYHPDLFGEAVLTFKGRQWIWSGRNLNCKLEIKVKRRSSLRCPGCQAIYKKREWTREVVTEDEAFRERFGGYWPYVAYGWDDTTWMSRHDKAG